MIDYSTKKKMWKISWNFVYSNSFKLCSADLPSIRRDFFTKSRKLRILSRKKFVKLCVHLSYIAQTSFHFDETFHRNFKIPIVVLKRHLVAIRQCSILIDFMTVLYTRWRIITHKIKNWILIARIYFWKTLWNFIYVYAT